METTKIPVSKISSDFLAKIQESLIQAKGDPRQKVNIPTFNVAEEALRGVMGKKGSQNYSLAKAEQVTGSKGGDYVNMTLEKKGGYDVQVQVFDNGKVTVGIPKENKTATYEVQ